MSCWGRTQKIFAPDLVNLFSCTIGDSRFIGPFVEITRGVTVSERCLIESHSFICDHVHQVFIGLGVMSTNDLYPMAYRQVKRKAMMIGNHASLGVNATTIGGARIGQQPIIGAGAAVTKDVQDCAIAISNPARLKRQFNDHESLRAFIEARLSLARRS
jgi:UDP-2-acetamido-3-amino-2,3-dideoxy-glucuronate N-acetyltransferase